MGFKEKAIYGILIFIIGLMIKVHVSDVFGHMFATVGAFLAGYGAVAMAQSWKCLRNSRGDDRCSTSYLKPITVTCSTVA
nr:MAG TPA: hypothetical protein [Caudoviricetes sp.]